MDDDGAPRRGLGSVAAVAVVAAVIGGLATAGGLVVTGAVDGGSTTEVRTVTASAPDAMSADAAAAAEMVGDASEEDGRTQVAQIYDEASPSVALIEAEVSRQTLSPFGPQGQNGSASGSGFVYDDKGHVVTNAHVVEGAQRITVSFGDQEALDAELTGILVGSDLAVLKVDPSKVPAAPLPLADSSSLDVGDPVVAIGNPFGLERTVTTGIISALQREIEAPDGTAITDVIQTDAAINPGNSGGPLLDEEGRVIGVNTQIISQSGGNEGIGLAVPSNTVTKIVDQIIATGKAELPFLGVGGQDLTPEVAAGVGLPSDLRGLVVQQVTSGSGAAKAGLQDGDVITAVDGEPVTNQNELSAAIIRRDVGDTVTVTVVRGGDRQTIEATLGARPGG